MPPSTPRGRGETVVTGARWHARAAPIAVACAAVALGPVLAGWRQAGAASRVQEQAESLRFPAAGNGSQWLASPAVGGWLPQFPGADDERLLEFSQGAARVAVYTATYLRQGQGRELVGHDSHIEGRNPGRLTRLAGAVTLDQPSMSLAEGEWQDPDGGRAVFWWIYQIGSRQFTSGLRAQLWYGTSSLWSAPRSSIVVLRSECLPDCGHARDVLRRFAGATMTALLAAAGDRRDSAR
jgi:EpsI family protein